MRRLDWLPALGFALGAGAAWYWGLPIAVIAFLAVAAVGWVVTPREEQQ